VKNTLEPSEDAPQKVTGEVTSQTADVLQEEVPATFTVTAPGWPPSRRA
jgi:hypothetical protein